MAKVEIKIPESLDEITVEQYQRYSLVEEPGYEETLNILANIPMSVIMKMKPEDVKETAGHIAGLFEGDNSLQSKFEMNGVTYGFIPKLDDITYGENKDLTTFLGDTKNLHLSMAVMYRKVSNEFGDKYLIEDYMTDKMLSEKMKQAPISVALGASVFFYNLTNALLRAIPNYLDRVSTQEIHSHPEGSQKNGASMKKLLSSQMIKFKESLEYLTEHR